MRNFGDTITNTTTGKRFFVSTVPLKNMDNRYWQTVVFRQKFGPFAGLFRPVLMLSGSREQYAKAQHEQVNKLVRDLPEPKWFVARDELARSIIERELMHMTCEQSLEETSASREELFHSLLRMTGTEPE